jgi:hypothetical protein
MSASVPEVTDETLPEPSVLVSCRMHKHVEIFLLTLSRLFVSVCVGWAFYQNCSKKIFEDIMNSKRTFSKSYRKRYVSGVHQTTLLF